MTILITIFIYLINFINALLRKHSKLLLSLMIVLIWVLMGANTQNPDIYAYQLSYSNSNLVSLEIGYRGLEKIASFLSMDYLTFRMIISALGILLIHQTVKRLTNNRTAFYLLYFIYPFLLDVVQTRNFLAMSIFIFAVPYLLSDKKRDLIKYILFIIIASSIQITAIVYLPIVLFIRKRKSILFKILIIEGIVFLILISLNQSALDILSQILINTIGSYSVRLAKYAYRQTSFGFLLFWFMQFTNFLLVYWANQNFKFTNNNRASSERTVNSIKNNALEVNNFQQKYVVLILWINAYAFLFLPFYVFQSTFSRFMRNIVPLNLLAYVVTGQNLPPKSVKKLLFTITYIGYNLFLFYMDVYILYSESIVKAIFRYNWLLP